jgi:hypothetical protein
MSKIPLASSPEVVRSTVAPPPYTFYSLIMAPPFTVVGKVHLICWENLAAALHHHAVCGILGGGFCCPLCLDLCHDPRLGGDEFLRGRLPLHELARELGSGRPCAWSSSPREGQRNASPTSPWKTKWGVWAALGMLEVMPPSPLRHRNRYRSSSRHTLAEALAIAAVGMGVARCGWFSPKCRWSGDASWRRLWMWWTSSDMLHGGGNGIAYVWRQQTRGCVVRSINRWRREPSWHCLGMWWSLSVHAGEHRLVEELPWCEQGNCIIKIGWPTTLCSLTGWSIKWFVSFE